MSKAEKLLDLMMNEAASDGEVLNARRILIRELKSLIKRMVDYLVLEILD